MPRGRGQESLVAAPSRRWGWESAATDTSFIAKHSSTLSLSSAGVLPDVFFLMA